MDNVLENIALAIVLMAIVTYIPRAFPILLLSGKKMPKPLVRWLSYVPVSVMAALLIPALLVREEKLDISITGNPVFWVSIPVFLIAILTRNLFITVLSGMAGVAILRLLLS